MTVPDFYEKRDKKIGNARMNDFYKLFSYGMGAIL